jgi:tetratricopeptide (TPR) repeat protein
MKMYSDLRQHVISSAISLVAMLCVTTGNVCAQDANLKTAGMLVQPVSLGIVPPHSTDKTTEGKDVFDGDIITAQTYSTQGLIYSENGRYDLAISEFNKALKIAPSSPELYNNRGIVYSKSGQYDLAISDFTKAVELAPNATQAYYNRGITYLIKDQYKLAFSDLNKALDIDPLYKSAYDIRGSMYGVLACSDWQKACKLGDCEHFKKATTAGLCTAMNGDINSSQ